MKRRPTLTIESLALHLKGRDVRAIVRGQLDLRVFWVLFGPKDAGGYRVDNYIWKAGWKPGGDSLGSGESASDGWDLLGALFVRAFTEVE